jgi:hypothetical protein
MCSVRFVTPVSGRSETCTIKAAPIEDRCSLRGCSWRFDGSALVPKPIPIQHVCAKEFDWLARRRGVDDQLGKAHPITPEDGRALPCQPVWFALRFSCEEIESLLSTGRQILGKAKGGSAPCEIWPPDGIPPETCPRSKSSTDSLPHGREGRD